MSVKGETNEPRPDRNRSDNSTYGSPMVRDQMRFSSLYVFVVGLEGDETSVPCLCCGSLMHPGVDARRMRQEGKWRRRSRGAVEGTARS